MLTWTCTSRPVPREVAVDESTFEGLHEGNVVKAKFGKGALGAPYWISLRP